MRVLVTGARSPACLEWCRVLASAGCVVAVADSVWFPLARFSSYAERFFLLPEPVRDVHIYAGALQRAARTFCADLILPTCEEAFYIAHQKRRLEEQCRVLAADFTLMATLHDKGAFAEFALSLPVSVPQTDRIESIGALPAFAERGKTIVFKPVFSRFAARCLIQPGPKEIAALRPTVEQPWIAQEYIAGRELCSFSIMQEGRLLAHACYHPRYRVGRGSGVYFEPNDREEIRTFLHTFGETTRYTGQIGFDFIDAADRGLFVLECNPRATSGIHLLSEQPKELARTLQCSENGPLVSASRSPRMVKLAAALFVLPGLRSKAELGDFVGAWRRADDIIAGPDDRWPILAQWLGLGEMALRALLHRRSLLAATTADIEWNGQPLGDEP